MPIDSEVATAAAKAKLGDDPKVPGPKATAAYKGLAAGASGGAESKGAGAAGAEGQELTSTQRRAQSAHQAMMQMLAAQATGQ